MAKFFVTGIGTGVGKTVISAWLAKHWACDYWKPIQSGTSEETDAGLVNKWYPDVYIHKPAYIFPDPVSPHLASRRVGMHVKINEFSPPEAQNLIIEGAGGWMVPLNSEHTWVDWVKLYQLPVIVVVRDYLGAINHTLLTLEAMKLQQITPIGLIFNGKPFEDNREIIQQFTSIPVLGYFPEVNSPVEISESSIISYPKGDFSQK